jgi:hypothetical protein
MPFSPTKLTFRTLGVAAVLLLLFPAAPARTQEIDQIDQTVARISYLSGPVSYNRGDDPEEWEAAATNVPFTIGDRIYSSADGRAELQLAAGNFVRLAPRSYFRALNLTYDTKQFYLGEGVASFNIRRLDRDETIEVNTPNMAVTLEGPGSYRVEVDEDGNSRVAVRRGRAIVAANGREVTVEDSEIRVYGVDPPRYEIFALRRPDAFDRWVDERDDRFERAYRGAYDYVSDEVIGAEELRDYGRWEQIPDYGYAWTPERVPVGWQPYTVGRWFWQDPWGWTWLSHEPWGWATCHYGRWAFHRGRWYWVPVGKRVRFVRYAPAHVVFVPVRGHVGWFPLHPRDRFVPWWSRRGGYEPTTYVHRTRVVIVERETFVSARRVTTNIVRDSVIVNEVTSARLMENQLPIPRRSSLRVADERESQSFQRPSQKLLSRPAVVRSAPPPPPPTFREKLPEIEKRQGAPIAPDAALAMGLRSIQGDNRMPIRPVAVEAGRADFAPRASAGSTPPPQPLSAARGKKLATRDEPFLTNLPKTSDRAERRPLQEEGKPTAPESSKGSARLVEPQQERQRQEREEEQRRELERQQREQERERQRQERALLEQQRKEQQQQRDEQQRRELERQQQLERERQRQARQLQEQQRQEQALRQQQERELERRQKEVERDRQREGLPQEQQQKEQQLRQQQVQKEPQPHKEQKRGGQQRREEEQLKSGVAKPPA